MKLIKNYEILGLDPLLIQILEDVDQIAGEGIITSAYRPGDAGVHGFFRGADRRCRNKALGNAIKDYVNRGYEYDPDREEMTCAMYHETIDKKTGRKKGFHLHFQVHRNSRRR